MKKFSRASCIVSANSYFCMTSRYTIPMWHWSTMEAPQHSRVVLCLPPGDKSWLVHILQILLENVPLLYLNNLFIYLYYNSGQMYLCSKLPCLFKRSIRRELICKWRTIRKTKLNSCNSAVTKENLSQHLYLHIFSNHTKSYRKTEVKMYNENRCFVFFTMSGLLVSIF